MNATATNVTAAHPEKAPTSLHEVLAAEGTREAAAKKILEETLGKFGKPDYFSGRIRTLELVDGSASTKLAQEAAESAVVPVATSVVDTIKYALEFWAKSEDVKATKNATNCMAMADLTLPDGTVLALDVPVDELMGLEARFAELKKIFVMAPSLDAKKDWVPSDKWPVTGLMQSAISQSTKTEKTPYAIIMAPATDKFPAQVKEHVRTDVIGTFSDQTFSSALTTDQKAKLISFMDDLILAARQARNRANSVTIVDRKIGTAVAEAIMDVLK